MGFLQKFMELSKGAKIAVVAGIVVLCAICMSLANGSKSSKTSTIAATSAASTTAASTEAASSATIATTNAEHPINVVTNFNTVANYTATFQKSGTTGYYIDYEGCTVTANRASDSAPLLVTGEGGSFSTMRDAFCYAASVVNTSVTFDQAAAAFDAAYPDGEATTADEDGTATLGNMSCDFGYASNGGCKWQITRTF